MSTPFSFTGSLNLPGGPGLPPDAIAIQLSSSFDNSAEFRLVLVGSGTQVVNLGTIASPGLKGLLLQVEANTTAAPVGVKINSSATGIEVSPGGFMAIGSPNPIAGTTAISITFTTDVVVRIWALG